MFQSLTGALESVFSATRDAFGQQVRLGTANRGDLGSHFRFDPESYRLYRNGSREFLLYDQTFIDTNVNSDGTFNDLGDTYTLQPNAGDTMRLQTAERFRYVVMFESEFSHAWQTNRPLQDNEEVRIIFDGSPPGEFDVDGHGIIYDADGARQVIIRDGAEIVSKNAPDAQPPDTWSIYDNVFNWYNVGRKEGTEFYGDGVRQRTVDLGEIITDNQRGPQVGNGRITITVSADTASDLEFEAGSMGFRNLGDTTPKTRGKGFPIDATIDDGTDVYEPIAALRISDEDFLVTTDILGVSPIDAPGDTDFLVIVADPSNTDATGFGSVPETNPLASGIELTTTVSTFPDVDGNAVSTTANPGGYQLAYSNSNTSGVGTNTRQSNTQRERRRRLHDLDYALILANGDTTGDVRLALYSDQER